MSLPASLPALQRATPPAFRFYHYNTVLYCTLLGTLALTGVVPGPTTCILLSTTAPACNSRICCIMNALFVTSDRFHDHILWAVGHVS